MFLNLSDSQNFKNNQTEPISILKDKTKKNLNKKSSKNSNVDLLFFGATHIEKERDDNGLITKKSIEDLNKEYIESKLNKNHKS